MHLDQAPKQARDAQITRMMEAYGESLLRMCFLLLQDGEQARDAVQETFLKAYRRWDSFRGESGELTWLTRIAINTCKDMRRTSWFRWVNRKVSLDDLPEQAYVQRYQDNEVLQAVTALPEKYRTAVLLYYYQGMTQDEIAQTLGIPVSTVKTRLKRAKDRLRDSLKGWVPDEQFL